MIGFCTAPRRASAAITTIVSSVVGQLPRHDRARTDAVAASAAAAASAASRSWRPVERTAVVVGEDHVVGPLLGGLLDQRPHRRRVRRDAGVGVPRHGRRP